MFVLDHRVLTVALIARRINLIPDALPAIGVAEKVVDEALEPTRNGIRPGT